MRSNLKLLSAALVLGIGLGIGGAQDYSLIRSTIDGGGGRSSGGPYTAEVTIGQHDTGGSSREPYALAGGYWGMTA